MEEPEIRQSANRINRRIVIAGMATAGVIATVGKAATSTPQWAPAGSPIASPIASPEGSPIATALVLLTNELRFEPELLTVPLGTLVSWLNVSGFPHTATCDPGQNPVAKSHPEYIVLPEGAAPWGSPLLQPNDAWSYQFKTPGDYLYICVPHVLSGMRARIQVTERSGR